MSAPTMASPTPCRSRFTAMTFNDSFSVSCSVCVAEEENFASITVCGSALPKRKCPLRPSIVADGRNSKLFCITKARLTSCPTGSSRHGSETHAASSAQKRAVAITGDFEYIRSALQYWSPGFSRGFAPAEAGAPPEGVSQMLSEFRNEPLTDFTKPENKAAMEAALLRVKEEFGREYPLVIGGQRITGL